jgi:hypothetical protein
MTEKIYGFLFQDLYSGKYYVKLPDGRIHGFLPVGKNCEILFRNRWTATQLAYDREIDDCYLEGFFDVILPQGMPIRF